MINFTECRLALVPSGSPRGFSVAMPWSVSFVVSTTNTERV